MPRKAWLAIASVASSMLFWWLEWWGVLSPNNPASNILLLLTMPGGIALVLIAGVHGSSSELVNDLALVGAVLVNATVYFLIFLGMDYLVGRSRP